MWFSSWFGKRQRTAPSGCGHEPPRKRPTCRPRLEVLENRWLPSHVGLTVTSLADSGPGTLRAAILSADAGSQRDSFTIDFAVDGTIDLQTPLPDLNNSIAIQGPGATRLAVERAAGFSFTSAIVTVDAGQRASLSGLTIANGNASGIFVFGTLSLAGCDITGNSTRSSGGGIVNLGTLTVSGCVISGNSATFVGGGIISSGTMTVSDSTLSGNIDQPPYPGFPTAGGAIFSDGILTVSASTVSGNSAAFGGGIYNQGTLTVTGSTLSANTASSNGGGIYNSPGNGYSTVVSASTISGNSATYGGGIYNNNFSSVTVRDSVFTGNSADQGGGIYNNAFATLDVRGSTFTNNSASDSGGGIYNGGTATLQGCTLAGNTAGSAGGGLFNGSSGTLVVKDSTVLNNLAPSGADLYNLGALTLDDSTVGVLGPLTLEAEPAP
jgi:predicted outer membrane repeat protein